MEKKYLSKNDFKLISRAIKYCNKYKIKTIFLLIAIIAIIVINIIQPLLMGKIIENVSLKSYEKIHIYIIFLGIIYILQSGINIFKFYLENSINNNIIYDLKNDMYNKIINLSMSSLDKTTIGELMSRLQGDVSVLADIVTNQIINIIVCLLKISILGIAIFKINITLAIIVIITFPLNYILFLKTGKILRKKNKEIKKVNDLYFSEIQQTFLGIKHIKTFGITDIIYEKFIKISRVLTDKQINIGMIQVCSESISNILTAIDDILIIGVSIYLISKGALTIQLFIAFLSYSNQFTQSLNSLTRLNSSMQQMLVSLERVFSLIDGLKFSSHTYGGLELSKSVEGNITFENVAFSYDENEILKDINLKIEKNTCVSIVGKNGCGKSTILNLLLGLYSNTKGKILIDNIDLKDMSEKMIRKNISVVHQQPFLFNLSIKENFELICSDVTMKQIEDVCKDVYMDEYIKNLKYGYDAIVEENGKNLSGGQRQRLALAMCLIRNTPIIILDEATTALDSTSKMIIDKIIKDKCKNKTIIMVTHSISTIINSDEVLVVENGEVVAKGNHKYLIEHSDVYNNLYKNEIDIITKNCEEVS